MCNIDIKRFAKKSGVFLYEVAERLGISDPTMTRLLRKELDGEKKLEILSIIADLASEKNENKLLGQGKESSVENMQIALGALANALRYTRAGSDVDRIEVVDDGCAAVIYFIGGGSKEVTIECDSAIAAFVDVCKALM